MNLRSKAPIVCAALAVLFAACGSSSEGDADKPLTIWWFQWAPADGLQELGAEFEAETGIAVKVEQIPIASYQDKVFLEFGSSTTMSIYFSSIP